MELVNSNNITNNTPFHPAVGNLSTPRKSWMESVPRDFILVPWACALAVSYTARATDENVLIFNSLLTLGATALAIKSAPRLIDIGNRILGMVSNAKDWLQPAIPTPVQSTAAQYWPAFGAMVGIGLGTISSISKNYTVFGKDLSTCKNWSFNGNSSLQAINNWREEGVFADWTPATGGMALLSLSVDLPIIWKVLRGSNQTQPGVVGYVKNVWKHWVSMYAYPSVKTAGLLMSAYTIRLIIPTPSSIDVSGHALVAYVSIRVGIAKLNAVREAGSNTQIGLYCLLLTIRAVSDAVRLYNTTAECHSPVEVVLGVACSWTATYALQLAGAGAKKAGTVAMSLIRKTPKTEAIPQNSSS